MANAVSLPRFRLFAPLHALPPIFTLTRHTPTVTLAQHRHSGPLDPQYHYDVPTLEPPPSLRPPPDPAMREAIQQADAANWRIGARARAHAPNIGVRITPTRLLSRM